MTDKDVSDSLGSSSQSLKTAVSSHNNNFSGIRGNEKEKEFVSFKISAVDKSKIDEIDEKDEKSEDYLEELSAIDEQENKNSPFANFWGEVVDDCEKSQSGEDDERIVCLTIKIKISDIRKVSEMEEGTVVEIDAEKTTEYASGREVKEDIKVPMSAEEAQGIMNDIKEKGAKPNKDMNGKENMENNSNKESQEDGKSSDQSEVEEVISDEKPATSVKSAKAEPVQQKIIERSQ